MDILLSKVTQHAMNYAIRSGIAITSGYAISQCSRLMKTQEGKERQELAALQRRLDSKIRIISPAIDMIELITARGNTSLESCVSLTKNLRFDIQALGARLANAAADEETSQRKGARADSKVQRDLELKLIISDMKTLLQRLEDAVPLISLAITTSGVSLSTNLPASISPSRLLQASTFLSSGDTHYAANRGSKAQIGPSFTLSMYMLFAGHTNRLQDEEGLRHATWQEVIHKARVKLVRMPIVELGRLTSLGKMRQGQRSAESLHDHMPAAASADEFAYQLSFVEDLDDGRVHTVEDEQLEPGSFDDVLIAGIREAVPIHQISKIFYADTGKILNIGSDGETNSPVLLLKRDLNAVPPRRMMEQDQGDDAVDQSEPEGNDVSVASPAQEQMLRELSTQLETEPQEIRELGLPPGLDPEWLALEVFVDEPESDSESELGAEEDLGESISKSGGPGQDSVSGGLSAHLSTLRLSDSPGFNGHVVDATQRSPDPASNGLLAGGGIRTSLSLLEMLIRLASLQQFQQASHLTINDELINFFLEESSTTGAESGDTDARKRIRLEARQKVGFDPYNESPIKRRGEQYQYNQDSHWDQSPSHDWDQDKSPSIGDSADVAQTPLLLRSKEHSSGPRSGASISSLSRRTTSPRPQATPVRRSFVSYATPPGTTKSREAFLKEEATRAARGSSSPLARRKNSSSP